MANGMYVFTIAVLVLCTLQSISCDENEKTHETVKNGTNDILAYWPLGLTRKNKVVAIMPLRMALNKLAVRATGKSKEELLTSLGVTTDKNLTKYYPELNEYIRCLRETSLIMLNRLYVEESDDLDPGFLKDVEVFGVQVHKTRFKMPRMTTTAINQWVDAATLKRIPDIITESDINEDTNMVLINALHMKPTWLTPFDMRLSLVKPFTLLNKTQVTMRMMTALGIQSNYAENKEHGFQLLSVFLDCYRCSLTYVLPRDPAGLPNLVKVLAQHPDLIPSMLNNLKTVKLNVRLPVMKIKTFINWNQYLKGIGVREIFDANNAGLDAILKPNRTKKYHMSQFLSKVFLDVDEFGIHRKAPEGVLDLSRLNEMEQVDQFLAIHPFYFRVDIWGFFLDEFSYKEVLSGVFYGTD